MCCEKCSGAHSLLISSVEIFPGRIFPLFSPRCFYYLKKIFEMFQFCNNFYKTFSARQGAGAGIQYIALSG